MAIQSLHGEILVEEDFIDPTGSSPVVTSKPTNIAGDPVGGDTSEYLLRLDLEDFTGEHNMMTSDVNQQLRSSQQHACTCHDCQVGCDHGADDQGLLDRAREIRNDIQATFAQLGDEPLPEGCLC